MADVAIIRRKENFEKFQTILENMDYSIYKKFNREFKSWYHETFSDDDKYTELVDTITFNDILDRIYCGSDIYKYLADDSIIRERFFNYISEQLNIDYEIIYDSWIFAN